MSITSQFDHTFHLILDYFDVFILCWTSETLDFKFLLKPKYSNLPCLVEEGPNRQLIGGTLQGDARLAVFSLFGADVLEYQVFIKADRVSPFDLAASWRAYQENLRPSAVRGIPDISINSVSQMGTEVYYKFEEKFIFNVNTSYILDILWKDLHFQILSYYGY